MLREARKVPKGVVGFVLAALAALVVILAAGSWLGVQMRVRPEPYNRPDFSPDGEWVVHEREGANHRKDLWIARPDDSGARRLVEGGEHPSWSPDGETILYTDQARLFTVPAEGGEPQRLAVGASDEAGPPVGAAWSRGGEAIQSTRYGREGWRVWRFDLETGETQAIGPVGAMRVTETFDGRSLVYVLGREDRIELILADAATGAEMVIGPSVVDATAFDVSEKAVYWIEPGPDPYGEGCLWRYDLATAATRKLGAVFDRPRLGLAVSPDDATVVVSRIFGEDPRFQVFENEREPRP